MSNAFATAATELATHRVGERQTIYSLPFCQDVPFEKQNTNIFGVSMHVVDMDGKSRIQFLNDGIAADVLSRANPKFVANIFAGAMDIAKLRPLWDLKCVEQIPLLYHHIEGLTQAYDALRSTRAVELTRTKSALRMAVEARTLGLAGDTKEFARKARGWLSKSRALIKMVNKPVSYPLFKDKIGYEPFADDNGLKTASRIYMGNGKDRQTLLVLWMYGKDRPQAMGLFGKIWKSTTQAMLDLNPNEPKLGAMLADTAQALRVALPLIQERLHQQLVIARDHPQAYKLLNVMLDHVTGLQGCFEVLDKPSDRITSVLRMNANQRERYYAQHEEAMALNHAYVTVEKQKIAWLVPNRGQRRRRAPQHKVAAE